MSFLQNPLRRRPWELGPDTITPPPIPQIPAATPPFLPEDQAQPAPVMTQRRPEPRTVTFGRPQPPTPGASPPQPPTDPSERYRADERELYDQGRQDLNKQRAALEAANAPVPELERRGGWHQLLAGLADMTTITDDFVPDLRYKNYDEVAAASRAREDAAARAKDYGDLGRQTAQMRQAASSVADRYKPDDISANQLANLAVSGIVAVPEGGDDSRYAWVTEIGGKRYGQINDNTKMTISREDYKSLTGMELPAGVAQVQMSEEEYRQAGYGKPTAPQPRTSVTTNRRTGQGIATRVSPDGTVSSEVVPAPPGFAPEPPSPPRQRAPSWAPYYDESGRQIGFYDRNDPSNVSAPTTGVAGRPPRETPQKDPTDIPGLRSVNRDVGEMADMQVADAVQRVSSGVTGWLGMGSSPEDEAGKLRAWAEVIAADTNRSARNQVTTGQQILEQAVMPRLRAAAVGDEKAAKIMQALGAAPEPPQVPGVAPEVPAIPVAQPAQAAAPAVSPAPVAAQPAQPASPAQPGALMSRDEFIADFTADQGVPPTEDQLNKARGVYWQ